MEEQEPVSEGLEAVPEDAVLLPFPRDGPLGKQGEVLSLPELRDILGEFAWGALAKGTAKVYKLIFHIKLSK